jgi:hypothetical protein
MPDRMAARLDDEEPVGGPRNDATVQVGRRDEELVRAPVRPGDARQRLSAVRPGALAAKRGDEPNAGAIAGAPRLAQSEWARADPLTRREGEVC